MKGKRMGDLKYGIWELWEMLGRRWEVGARGWEIQIWDMGGGSEWTGVEGPDWVSADQFTLHSLSYNTLTV